MKTCTFCKESKTLNDFSWRNKLAGTYLSRCKACLSKQAKDRWSSGTIKNSNYAAKARRVERAKDYLWSVLSSSVCADCGETNPMVFEFDHLGDKTKDVSKMVSQNYGVDAIRQEVSKCEVVCANCHKIRTATRAGTWRTSRLASSE